MSNKKIVDHETIRELAELLHETGLTEIEVSREGTSIRVVRTDRATAPAIPSLAGPPAATATPATNPAPTPTEDAAAARDPGNHPGLVRSPMVGTAFRGPEPGAAPFVGVGDQVREGQTLIIVEAMKTMNQIPAPRTGTVSDILVDDGQPVEYDEPLLIIE